MKIFNNIKKLWDYALYCPICESSCRTISLSLIPDELFLSNTSFVKTDDILSVNFTFSIKNRTNSITKINGILKINCLDNSFSIKDYDYGYELNQDSITSLLIKKINKEKYFVELYLESHCMVCFNSSIYSSDIELDLKDKSLKDIKLDLERVEITINNSEIYHIEQKYDVGHTWIDQYYTLDDGRLKRKATYKNNLLDIDFSSLKKSFKRIKTILVFS